jgi:ATP-dependent Lon protease
VTTANTLNIPARCLDRMEVIRIAGYTEEEKSEIAGHLIPKCAEEARVDGRRSGRSTTMDAELIRRYTREAGVRNLRARAART